MTPEKEAALDLYCEKVMERLEQLLSGATELGAQMQANVAVQISQHVKWIAQEQVKAFEHGASVEECARWLASELRAFRARRN